MSKLKQSRITVVSKFFIITVAVTFSMGTLLLMLNSLPKDSMVMNTKHFRVNNQHIMHHPPAASANAIKTNQPYPPISNQLYSTEKPYVDVTVILLTFNNSKYLEEIIQSLFDGKDMGWSIFVVIADNGCFEETHDVVRRLLNNTNNYKNITYLQICDNKSYSIANNLAVKSSPTSSKWILFLNDDVIPAEDFFTQMKAVYDANNALGIKIGALAPKMLFANGRVVEAGRSANLQISYIIIQ